MSEPSGYQLAIWESMRTGRGRNVVVKSGAGTAKCLGKGTPVMLASGDIVAVEDVRPGMLLMGPDSRPRRVKAVAQGRGPLFEVRPHKGTPWVCNDEHVLTLIHSGTSQVFDIPLDYYLAHKEQKIFADAKLFRVAVSFAPRPIPNDLDPYLIGLWLGDGHTDQPTITAHINDLETRQYCEAAAKKHGAELMIRPDKRSPNVLALRFRMGPRGIGGRSTPHLIWRTFKQCRDEQGKKRIPLWLLRNTTEVRRRLLAGLIDTDGHVDSNCAVISTALIGMRDDILYLARSLGLAAYAKEMLIKGRTYYRVSISGELGVIPTRLPRKYLAPRAQKKDALRTGFEAIPLGDGDFYGFMLSGDGRFLLGDFTVTHNTTTIVYGVAQIPPEAGPVLITAFTRGDRDSIERVLVPSQYGTKVRVLTIGGVGWRLLMDAYPELRETKANEDRQYDLARTYLAEEGIRAKKESTLAAVKLAKLAKAYLFDTPEDILKLSGWHGLQPPNVQPRKLVAAVVKMLERTLSTFEKEGWGFDDLIWLPAKLGLMRAYYKTIVVDEAQDLSRADMALLRAVVGRGRIFAFGDPRQSIYRFKGADKDAIDNLVEGLDAIVMKLSISYRCAKKIIAEAQAYAPELEARPGAPDGEVHRIEVEELLEHVKVGDYVIARSNTAVVDVFTSIVAAGISARIALDPKVAELAIAIITDIGAYELKVLVATIKKEIAAIEKDEHVTPASQLRLDALGLVELLARQHKHTQTLQRELNSYAASAAPERGQQEYVWVATTHRAKGLEAERVFVRVDSYFEDDPERENLIHVAITRAKNVLFLVGRTEQEESRIVRGVDAETMADAFDMD